MGLRDDLNRDAMNAANARARARNASWKGKQSDPRYDHLLVKPKAADAGRATPKGYYNSTQGKSGQALEPKEYREKHGISLTSSSDARGRDHVTSTAAPIGQHNPNQLKSNHDKSSTSNPRGSDEYNRDELGRFAPE